MPAKKKTEEPIVFTHEWTLPAVATLGSSVRAKGILQEIRARMPFPRRKALDLRGMLLVLGLPQEKEADFQPLVALVETTLHGIENLPILPREIEDILAIKTSERHRWLKDGRLPSAGIRTVKLAGRAKKITFHVYDPRWVESMLDSGLIDDWREEDLEAAAEKRRRAAEMRAFARLGKKPAKRKPSDEEVDLKGWAEFERQGLLR